jgi:hypothetical protein
MRYLNTPITSFLIAAQQVRRTRIPPRKSTRKKTPKKIFGNTSNSISEDTPEDSAKDFSKDTSESPSGTVNKQPRRPRKSTRKNASYNTPEDTLEDSSRTPEEQPQRRPLFFVIGPRYSGVDEICEELEAEFETTLEFINTNDPGDRLVTLFPSTITNTSARPALLKQFPGSMEQWEAFLATSKHEGLPLWDDSKSLVIKVTTFQAGFWVRWEKAHAHIPDAEKGDAARVDAWYTYVREEEVVNTIWDVMDVGKLDVNGKLNIKDEGVDEVVKTLREMMGEEDEEEDEGEMKKAVRKKVGGGKKK